MRPFPLRRFLALERRSGTNPADTAAAESLLMLRSSYSHSARRGAATRARGAIGLNSLAALICLGTAGVLVLNFQATPPGHGTSSAQRFGVTSALSAAELPEEKPVAAGAATDLKPISTEEAVSTSRVAFELHITRLELGQQKLKALPHYTATFMKQERLDGAGEIPDMQTMDLKIRHQPFSVYMKWIEGGDRGREVLFVEGENDSKMLVKLGGIKRLLPTVKLDPTEALAMAESRHPVSKMGLLELTNQLITYRKRDFELKEGVRWQILPHLEFANRKCTGFLVEYASKSVEPVYRKSLVYIDQELHLPVCVHNYGWPEDGVTLAGKELDEATLIEHYGYADIHFDSPLETADFSNTNTNYRFRR